jgi:hypothetical protein
MSNQRDQTAPEEGWHVATIMPARRRSEPSGRAALVLRRRRPCPAGGPRTARKLRQLDPSLDIAEHRLGASVPDVHPPELAIRCDGSIDHFAHPPAIDQGGLGWNAIEHSVHEEPVRHSQIGKRPHPRQIQD